MIVALDVGLKRIGVAVAPDDKTALPSEPVLRRNRNQAAFEVSNLIRSRAAHTLVVGVPRGGSSEEEMERRIKHFVGLLDLDSNLKVEFVDESYSSAEASEFASDRARDGRFDSVAATIILERYLRGL